MKRAEIFSHLSHFRVGIAGAGGLGSNCAIALARTNIGSLVISDFDLVSEANLDRQYYFIDQVGMKKVEALRHNIERTGFRNPVIVYDIKLDPVSIRQIYKDCDIIIEAFDDAVMKEMLAETVLSEWPEKILIMGSGMAGYGMSGILKERRIGDKLIVCGDETSEVNEDNPPLAARVGIVANMQANAVVDILMNIKAD